MKNYTKEQIDLIVEHCQPQYSTWWSEWLEANNQNEITSDNVFECLSANVDHVDLYIQENILEEEDDHEHDGSGDYLCDSCNKPVNTEDWCFSCNDYVYTHHIND